MFALSTCARCAEPIPHNAPRCSRCRTRYCGAACQAQHWNAGGHKDLCKKIKKRGGAEKANADAKYKAAVTDAVEDCKEATKGQTCFICTEGAVRRHAANEGLVTGYCACRGTAGFVHISCLVEQAKLAVADDMSREEQWEKWSRWHACRLCHQPIRGKVKCALGWACWRTYSDGSYLDRASGTFKAELNTFQAFNALGDSLPHEEALTIYQTLLAATKIAALHDANYRAMILVAETNVAKVLEELGRHDESLEIRRGLLGRTKAYHGATSRDTFIDALNLGNSLFETKKYEEAKALLPEYVDSCRATYGPDHRLTLKLRFSLCRSRGVVWDGSFEEVCESDKDLADIDRRARRVLGEGDPFIQNIKAEQLKRKIYHDGMAKAGDKQRSDAEIEEMFTAAAAENGVDVAKAEAAAREREREAELQKRLVVVAPSPSGENRTIVASLDAINEKGILAPNLRKHIYTVAEATAKFGTNRPKMTKMIRDVVTGHDAAAKPKPAPAPKPKPAPAPKRAGIDYSKWDNLEDSD